MLYVVGLVVAFASGAVVGAWIFETWTFYQIGRDS